MKNKIVFLGSLCLILALGLVFVGCQDDGIQVVEFDSVGSPGNVTATFTTGSATTDSKLTVTWDAVSGAQGYKVVATQDGKKTYFDVNYTNVHIVQPTVGWTYADVDKWQAEVDANDAGNNLYGGAQWFMPEGTFKIGVIAQSPRTDINDSSPAWAKTPVTVKYYVAP